TARLSARMAAPSSSSDSSSSADEANHEMRRCAMLKRLLFAAYGVVSYLIFLGTFLYAIGFIGNLGTPTALDGPPRQPFVVALAVNAGLLTLFALQHSI